MFRLLIIQRSQWFCVKILLLLCAILHPIVSFSPPRDVHSCRQQPCFATPADGMDEIDSNLARAKALLEKSKAKLAEREANRFATGNSGNMKPSSADKNDSIPFFATSQSPEKSNKRELVTKSIDETTGLIRADGEKMAALSEEEEWEVRSLLEVFQNEMKDNEDVYSLASQQLGSNDVAASIFNLRKTLQKEDYQRIFDKKNIFIGEDT